MAIFISFGLLKDFRKKEVVRKGHEAPTREEGAPPVSGAPRVPLGLRFLVCDIFWSVKIHYIYSLRF